MQLTFADTPTGCKLTGTALNSTWAQAVPLSTANLKVLIASLLEDPDLTFVEGTGVVVARTNTGITIKTADGVFDIHWGVLVTVSGVCA